MLCLRGLCFVVCYLCCGSSLGQNLVFPASQKGPSSLQFSVRLGTTSRRVAGVWGGGEGRGARYYLCGWVGGGACLCNAHLYTTDIRSHPYTLTSIRMYIITCMYSLDYYAVEAHSCVDIVAKFTDEQYLTCKQLTKTLGSKRPALD